VPAATAALVPGLTCPACWPGYAALLSALGLGFIPTAPYLLPLTAGLLVVALAALALRESRVLFVLGAVASVVILLGKFVFESNPMNYLGAGLLLAASVPTVRRRGEAAACPACASDESARHGSPKTPMEGRWRAMVKSISLCPACDACPAVEIEEHEVRIGEAGNLVKLTPAEWNVLVQAIKAGELTEV